MIETPTDVIANELAIRLFLFGLAATAFLEAWKAERPRSYLPWAIFSAFLVLGTFFPQISAQIPGLARATSELVANPISWFGLFILAFFVCRVWWQKSPSGDAVETNEGNLSTTKEAVNVVDAVTYIGNEISASRSNEPQDEAGSLIYVGSATVHIDRMNQDNRAEIAIIAFNGNDFQVKITAPRNHIRMSYQMSESETAEEPLSTPILLTDRGPIVAAPRSEFMIVLHQYLTPAQIAAIKSALTIAHVTFNLLALEIDVESDDGKGALFRMPFTRSPNVSLAKAGEYKNNYTIFAWAKEVIGAPDLKLR